MATIKSYTDLQQSKKLAEILPLKTADMRFCFSHTLDGRTTGHYPMIGREPSLGTIPCWSLAALINNLPEINGISLKIEKVKAEDGYDGYYYPIEYEGIVLIPYPKNPVDACYEMILKLHELNLL